MVDADSLLDPQALLNVARPFADDPGRVVAAGGVVRVANGSRVERGRVTQLRMPSRFLSRIAVVEYLRAFLIGRAGWSRIGGLLIISGAFGIFRKDVLLEVGGMSTNSIGEDAELVVRIHRLLGDRHEDGQVVFVPEPVAWTEVPETRAVLRKQRRRWHRGLAEIFLRHGSMLLRPRYGVIGMVTMPWFLVFELLAPIVEVLGLVWFLVLLVLLVAERWYPTTDLVDPEFLLVLLSASVLFAVFVTLVALLAEELSFRRYRGLGDLARAVWAAVEENFGYRQLNAFWRLGGLMEAVRRTRHDWGEMTRKGFDSGVSGGNASIAAPVAGGGILAAGPGSRRPHRRTTTRRPGERTPMKKDIHPDYVPTTVTCTCGATFTTRSTATSGVIHADVCSQCHPFYTGKQKILDTGGRVARFEKRYAQAGQNKK